MTMTKPSAFCAKRGTVRSAATRRMMALAGVLYSTAGFVVLMGIITAETKYPFWRHYSTRQEISDLGGTRPPHSVVTQPAATIFDVTMMVAGVLLLVAVWAAWRHYQHPWRLSLSRTRRQQRQRRVDRGRCGRTLGCLPDHLVAALLRRPPAGSDARACSSRGGAGSEPLYG